MGKTRSILSLLPALLMAAFLTGLAQAQTKAPQGPLTLDDCVETALSAHPSIASAASGVSAAVSRVGQARSAYYPALELSGGYSRIGGGASDEGYSAGVGLRQNIYDFGRTPALIRVREYNAEALRVGLEGVRNQVALNVKRAYYELLRAQKARGVREEQVRQFERHLEQARGFYEVGTKPRIDLTRAEVALSDARVELIRADNALKIARVGLKTAMGAPDAPDFDIADDLAFRPMAVSMDAALERAFSERPDLRAASFESRSAAGSVELASRDYYPALSGSASYNRTGDAFPLEEGWNAAATVTVPIFSGFLTKHQVSEARANQKAAEAEEELRRLSAVFEVRQAYLNLVDAAERIPASELGVRQASENLELANARYSTGVGSPIEVTDASAALASARLSYYQALADHRAAEAALVSAMGGR